MRQSTTLEFVRNVYRPLPFETLLLCAFGIQIALGIRLALNRWRQRPTDPWARLQLGSGVILAIFIVLHIGAALIARHVAHVDTNFFWPAGTLVLAPLKYWFAPYYWIAVCALFAHLAAALHFHGKASRAKMLLAIGPVLGIAMILPFTGALFPIDLPTGHLAYFEGYLGATP